MFGLISKSKFEELKETVEKLTDLYNATKTELKFQSACFDEKVKRYNEVACETCGCQIKKENAVKGESEIRKRHKHVGDVYLKSYNEVEALNEDYIHYPYYCKKCVPKKKTTKK